MHAFMNLKIELKVLISEHTLNEGDAVHLIIEKQIKKTTKNKAKITSLIST